MIIRPAAPHELEPLLALWEALMANGNAADPRFRATPDARAHMREWARNTWFEQRPFVRMWVAAAPNLVGFVHGFPRAALPIIDFPPTVRIGDLFVQPDARGEGLGRSLVNHLLQGAASAGYRRAEVSTLTADARAVAFWAKLGFGDLMVTLSREPS